MATKKTPVTEDDALMPSTDGGELDQAIDDLRGVLKADSKGVPGFDDDFGNVGSDLAATDTPAFGSEFGADVGGSAFGGGDLGASDFGGSDFGASDLENQGFGTAEFGNEPFSASAHEPGSGLNANIDLIMDIPIDVEIVLGSSRMQVSGLMNLEEGATIALDKKIGEPVEIMVNGRRIGKGEITVLENDDTRFGVKVTEVLSTRKA